MARENAATIMAAMSASHIEIAPQALQAVLENGGAYLGRDVS
jgi:hypothetical protein